VHEMAGSLQCLDTPSLSTIMAGADSAMSV
jgi:hypothetical protein